MLDKNDVAPQIEATSISDQIVNLQKLRGKKVLIKFHRFSGCPVARRQLSDFAKQQPALNAAGVVTIVFLHSSQAKVTPNFTEVPGLHIIADRQKSFYKRFGARFLASKLLSLATWVATFAAILRGYFPHFHRLEGGVFGVPSDFLLDESGRIVDLHHGQHYGDSWSASEVLRRVDRLRPRASSDPEL